jgi:predicted nucleic-acid-binding protein
MKAVDTNIVLRRLLQDDKAQAAKANTLFDGDDETCCAWLVFGSPHHPR